MACQPTTRTLAELRSMFGLSPKAFDALRAFMSDRDARSDITDEALRDVAAWFAGEVHESHQAYPGGPPDSLDLRERTEAYFRDYCQWRDRVPRPALVEGG